MEVANGSGALTAMLGVLEQNTELINRIIQAFFAHDILYIAQISVPFFRARVYVRSCAMPCLVLLR